MWKSGHRWLIVRPRIPRRSRLGALAIWCLGAIALLDVAVHAGLAWR